MYSQKSLKISSISRLFNEFLTIILFPNSINYYFQILHTFINAFIINIQITFLDLFWKYLISITVRIHLVKDRLVCKILNYFQCILNMDSYLYYFCYRDRYILYLKKNKINNFLFYLFSIFRLYKNLFNLLCLYPSLYKLQYGISKSLKNVHT